MKLVLQQIELFKMQLPAFRHSNQSRRSLKLANLYKIASKKQRESFQSLRATNTLQFKDFEDKIQLQSRRMRKQLENQIYYLRERFTSDKEYQSDGLQALRALGFHLRVVQALMRADYNAFGPGMHQRIQAINDRIKSFYDQGVEEQFQQMEREFTKLYVADMEETIVKVEIENSVNSSHEMA